MILPDVNVLIYAFRDDSPQHENCRQWLEDVINGPAAYGISTQVLAAVARITTNPRIYPNPSRLEDVFAFSQTLLTQPNTTLVLPGARHWMIFEDLCHKCGATGNLLQDAWFAALAIEWDCEWITTDRDYNRFPRLRWRVP